MTLGGVEGPSGDHCCRRRGPRPRPRSPRLRGVAGRGCTSSWPATGPRATPRSSLARGDPRRHRPRSPTSTVELIVELRRQLTAQGLDAGADTIGWHLEHHHHLRVSRATIDRTLRRQGLVTPAPAEAAPLVLRPLRKPSSPTRCGRPTSPTTALDHRRRRRDPVLARRPRPLRPVGHRPPAGHRPHRRRHLPARGRPARSTRVDPDRQRDGVHHPPGRRPRRPQRASRPNCAASASPRRTRRPNHPTTCGKVERFQQTLKTWLRAQPDQPATIAELQALLDVFVDIYNHHRPHRSLPQRATPAAAYTARPKADPGDRTRRHPLPGPPRPRRHGRQRHPAPQRPPPPHRPRHEPTPEPASSCSSPTSTSASSTPPPASSSATSPSTPPATTSPSADPPAHHPENHNSPTPNEGSGCPGCPETSQSGTGGIRTPEPFGRPLSRRVQSSALPPFRRPRVAALDDTRRPLCLDTHMR